MAVGPVQGAIASKRQVQTNNETSNRAQEARDDEAVKISLTRSSGKATLTSAPPSGGDEPAAEPV